jgi:hypothetical protein
MTRTHRRLVHILNTFLDRPPKVGAEVGVWEGHLSKTLLKTYRDLSLIMVDRWQPYSDEELSVLRRRVNKNYKDVGHQQLIAALDATQEFWNRRMVVVSDSILAADNVQEELDFVYLDAGHRYEDVAADLKAWYPNVRAGGVICGHDYKQDPDDYRFGVVKAVNEFCDQYKYKQPLVSNLTWGIKKR